MAKASAPPATTDLSSNIAEAGGSTTLALPEGEVVTIDVPVPLRWRGEAGVAEVLDILAADVDRTLALIGAKPFDDVDSNCLYGQLDR